VTLVQIREPGYRPPRPEALEQAATVPDRLSEAPGNVRRSRTASSRLARLAAKFEAGELHRGPGREGGVTLEFAEGRALSAEQCGHLVETFGGRLLFKSGTQFGLTLAAGADTPLLADTRNLLQVAYFSTRIGVSPGH